MCELPGSLGIPVFQRLFRAAGSGDLLYTLEVNAALRQLASITHLHPNYLIKYFHKHFAESPIV